MLVQICAVLVLSNDRSRNASMDKSFCSPLRNQGYKRQTATHYRIESQPLTDRNVRLKALLLIQAIDWQHKWQWDGWLSFRESVAMAMQLVSCNTDELRARCDKYTTAISKQYKFEKLITKDPELNFDKRLQMGGNLAIYRHNLHR